MQYACCMLSHALCMNATITYSVETIAFGQALCLCAYSVCTCSLTCTECTSIHVTAVVTSKLVFPAVTHTTEDTETPSPPTYKKPTPIKVIPAHPTQPVPQPVQPGPPDQPVIQPILKKKDPTCAPLLSREPGWYQQMFQNFSNKVQETFPNGIRLPIKK